MQARNSDLLTPGEVAAIFRVTTATIAIWRRAGKLTGIRTPGGRYRYSVAANPELAALAVDGQRIAAP